MFIKEDTNRVLLPWETLDALIHGVSSIDLTSMPTADRMEAENFVLHYGYDLQIQQDANEVRKIMDEAVRFIETLFLNNPTLNWEEEGEPSSPCTSIPPSVIASGDVRDLILAASDPDNPDRIWSCAILKVMHTIAHIQNGPLYRYFEEARAQILSEFDAILTPLSDDSVLLGKAGGRMMKIFGFETKDQKTRESILVKLLCKREHVAEAIWDLIGVRIITFTPADALLALNILREYKVLVFPNIIPSRSRNNLLDPDRFRREYTRLATDLSQDRIGMETFEQLVQQIDASFQEPREFSEQNPSSSQEYRSLHTTCRKLIRVKSPGQTGEYRFFFPYEIQILDKANYLESKEGQSAHSTYKKRQLAAARRRVLGTLLLR